MDDLLIIRLHYLYLYIQRWRLVGKKNWEKLRKIKNHCKVNKLPQKGSQYIHKKVQNDFFC